MVAAKQVRVLGDLAADRMTCGGVLSTPPQVCVNYYLGHPEVLRNVTFPGSEESDFQKVLESYKFMFSFRGAEPKATAIFPKEFRVTDNSYSFSNGVCRGEQFLTSFQLSDTAILGEVKQLLFPDAAVDLRARLSKMNIYTASTGGIKPHIIHFKPGLDVFVGTLMVCLPTEFHGGTIIVRKNGQQVTYDWSSTAMPVREIRWAALPCDTEREMLPVTEGYCVTLTYSLYTTAAYRSKDSLDYLHARAVECTSFPLFNYLKVALGHPHFLSDGGVLGFACQHTYVFWDNPDIVYQNNVRKLLVGPDLVVLFVADSLHLKVRVEPVITGAETVDHCNQIHEHLAKRRLREGFKFSAFECYEEEWEWEDYFAGLEDDEHIIWCQELQHKQPAVSAASYDGDNVYTCYQAAAILVDIPEWAKRQEILKKIK